MKPFFVYLLRCGEGSYYAGHTDDMEARMLQHQTTDTGYTSTRKPVEWVWHGEFESREGALAFEQQIKGWSRAKKEALIAGDWERIKSLAHAHGPIAEGLRQAQPERSDVQPERSDVQPERSDVQPERSDVQPERSDVQPERSDVQPERSDVQPERSDMQPARSDR
ncbi:GIY-YIG nuclease family protein [Hydrogenophaga sp.]|uniref:GIY-YIG nuclease family protein n=1 Tax=Hydrogenophaga sp. TaxID=1904254 RepID=UPI00198AB0E1|nr:GIY-YIG nuclease family protein [Hydrogenophaga sp.]MBD3893000.1 hypothetical protein [Hydrogenophaga sp.]